MSPEPQVEASPLRSRVYRGTLRHRRFTPRHHRFSYSVWMAYLDLDELPELFDQVPGFSARGRALARFRREDYLGPPNVPLKEAVRAEITRQLGHAPRGRICVLTQLRTLGGLFNPLSMYYAFDQNDRLSAVLGEVTNMPWRERTQYACQVDGRRRSHAAMIAKGMHVSPFNPMDMTYRWRFNTPAQRLLLHMENWHNSPAPHVPACQFDATLTLEGVPATRKALISALARQPLMSAKTVAGIHLQALRLWAKRIPIFDHPGRKETSS